MEVANGRNEIKQFSHDFDSSSQKDLKFCRKVVGLGRWDEMTGLHVFHGLYGKNANVFAAMLLSCKSSGQSSKEGSEQIILCGYCLLFFFDF